MLRFVEGTGHFVQLVWADTAAVGCGMVTHLTGGRLVRWVQYSTVHLTGGRLVRWVHLASTR